MPRLLHFPFRDSHRADRELRALATHLSPEVYTRLDLLLAASPAPEQALYSLTRLREQQPAAFARASASPAGLQALVPVFAHSRFLTEAVLRHPDWIDDLLDSDALERPLSEDELRARLIAALPAGVPPPVELAKFRRRQMLRIVARDVLAMGTLPEITGALTTLADVIVDVTYERIHQDLVAHYGQPQSAAGPVHFAVIALGKMGGEELNYSSDIDLMFLYSASGEPHLNQSSGRRPITNKEFFTRASNQLTALLSAFSGEGMCYRVDLRLRPDGSLGEVCIPLDTAKHYYESRARDWELQMLLKARAAAGHRPLGRELLEFVEPLIYKTTLDFSAVEEMSATRERLNEKLAARQSKKPAQKHAIHVKLDRGGIRDIEFLVQCLQRLHGGADAWVRHGGTMLALSRLQDKGHLTGAEYGKLASAYQFFRHLEHRLQFDEDRQTHSLPDDPQALELLARRMPGGDTAEWLITELRGHAEQIIEMYDLVVRTGSSPEANRQTARVVLALDQSAPILAELLSKTDLHRGFQAFQHFLERSSGDPARLARLNHDPALASATLDLFEHSPHFAEELIRTPELIEDVAHASVPFPNESAPHDAAELRRWYRRGMVRIQTESICGAHNIFDTLHRTSNLADGVIERIYNIAIADVSATHPSANPAYQPKDQMWVVALGRLGMLEFDLGSDADLIFVLANSDADEIVFWTRVANRILNLIMAYTGSGLLFAVDARLRPNGSAGPLVQMESAFKDYFEQSAEAWEGITYMKSRVVAGDAKRAVAFLNDLQTVDWRRYGQSGRSRTDLRQMRARLEKEQGASSPLKAGRGGYYDIDFLLMYLRLKSAGVFYKVLNTPERIEVLQILGHLSEEQARTLRDNATFYRALDHALRVISGHAEGKLPKSEAQRELLAEILPRWTPIPLARLDEIRSQTRALFDRFFG